MMKTLFALTLLFLYAVVAANYMVDVSAGLVSLLV